MEKKSQYDIDEVVFKRNWDEYVNNFIKTPSIEVDAIKQGGLLADENRNILEHLLMARKLGELLCNLLNVTDNERVCVISALTVHDAFVLDEKKFVREKTANKEKVNFQDLQFVKSESGKRLKKLGFTDEVINLTDDNITHEIGGPKQVLSKIMFIVDAMLSGSQIVDVPERFRLTNLGWRSDRNCFDEATRLGNRKYYEEFFTGAPGHNNRPHDEVQLETAHTICIDLVNQLKKSDTQSTNPEHNFVFGDDGNPDMLPYYLEYRLKKSMMVDNK